MSVSSVVSMPMPQWLRVGEYPCATFVYESVGLPTNACVHVIVSEMTVCTCQFVFCVDKGVCTVHSCVFFVCFFNTLIRAGMCEGFVKRGSCKHSTVHTVGRETFRLWIHTKTMTTPFFQLSPPPPDLSSVLEAQTWNWHQASHRKCGVAYFSKTSNYSFRHQQNQCH